MRKLKMLLGHARISCGITEKITGAFFDEASAGFLPLLYDKEFLKEMNFQKEWLIENRSNAWGNIRKIVTDKISTGIPGKIKKKNLLGNSTGILGCIFEEVIAESRIMKLLEKFQKEALSNSQRQTLFYNLEF